MSHRLLSLAGPSLLSVSCLLTVLRAQAPFGDPYPLPKDREEGGRSVTIKECRTWIETLASPEFEGRQTGKPGFQKAAEFVTRHFQSLGLEARGQDGTYYQHVPWGSTKVVPAQTFVKFQRGGETLLTVPHDRLGGRASAALSAAGDVLLLVVEAPATERSGSRLQLPTIPGLDTIEAEGKVVVVYVKKTPSTEGATDLARLAVRNGLSGKQAAAVLFAEDEAPAGGIVGTSGAGRRAGNPAIAGMNRAPMQIVFGGNDLAAMLKAADVDPAVLQATAMVPPITLKAEVEVAVSQEQAPAMNVWAVLPGSDPQRKHEYVVVGSHLDHVGMRGGLHPGADDDASGTTGVMAVAKMFEKNTVRPARSILFVCFAGEEDGLIGSDFFAKNCPIPLSSIVGELQMDMIGRDEEENREGNRGEKAEDNRTSLHLVGTQKLAPSLHELCLEKNKAAGFAIEYDQEGMFGRSDHANFAKMGVPIAFFFTGLHRDYHETADTPDKIHYEKLLRVATYVYDIAFDLATQPGRPEVDPDLWKKYRGKATQTPAAPLIGAPVQAGKPDGGQQEPGK